MNFEVNNKIYELSKQFVENAESNIFRSTLRELRNIFGSIYYTSKDGARTRLHCISGRMERPVGTVTKENTIILPCISIEELGVSNAEDRRRTGNMLVSEVIWDPREKRAKRLLSLPSRPVNLSYNINIWTKFQSDIDIIRSAIILMFNPALSVRTPFNDLAKAFLDSESDIASSEAADTTDRVLKKSISISLETYIPSPKFLFTNTGQIQSYNLEFQLFDAQQDMETDIPIDSESIKEKLS
jgi:hypothetical protein